MITHPDDQPAVPSWIIKLSGEEYGPYTRAQARVMLETYTDTSVELKRGEGEYQSRVVWLAEDKRRRVENAEETHHLTMAGFIFGGLAVVLTAFSYGEKTPITYAASGSVVFGSLIMICAGMVIREIRIQGEKSR